MVVTDQAEKNFLTFPDILMVATDQAEKNLMTFY